METETLYYADPHLRAFTAVVTDCVPQGDGFRIVLDRTCFYPEGGGQPGDRGTLNGVPVLDTQERDGVIYHETGAPLEPGTAVRGEIDWARRFDLMQQHSGEHMVSGVLHRRYGCNNVGFHMGAEAVTIDFDLPLTWEQLQEAEREVNDLIWQNAPVRCWYPTREELAALDYRSKKALDWPVRIVEFPGADRCACCGTHVAQTGEIGLVKLLSVEKFHQGVRVEMTAGLRAYGYLSAVTEQNRAVSRLLSAKPLETAAAVERLAGELAAQKQRAAALETARLRDKAESLRNQGDVLVRLEGLSSDGVRRAAAAIQETCGGRAAVFSGDDEGGYQYAVGLPGGDLRSWVMALNQALNGRGGGKPDFVQGSVRAPWEAIAAFFGTPSGAQGA